MNRNASRTARNLTMSSTACSILAAALVAGCSSAPEKKDIDYKTAKPINMENSNALAVPPDLVSPTSDDRFAVPGARGSASLSTYSVERQQAASHGGAEIVLPSATDKMRIERAGAERWLVVPGTPESVWPKLRTFWLDTGLVLTTELPQLGIMETDWAENRAKLPQDFVHRYLGAVLDPISDTNQRDKFRTRVEPSTTPGFVEIYVSHRGAEQIYNDTSAIRLAWQPMPSNPELEVEMLRRIMLKLGADEGASQQAVARVKNAPDHAKLSNASDGTMLLTVDEPVDRAWREVGLTLDRVGLVVEDRDRSKNTYFVRYVVAEDLNGKKDESWLSKLAFWRSKKDPGTDQYRIVVQANGASTNVSIQNKDGVAVPSQSAKQMLTLLYNEMK